MLRVGVRLSKSRVLSNSVRCAATVTEAATEEASDNITWENARPYEEIPGPKSLPIIGNLHQFISGIGEMSDKNLVDQNRKLLKKYGKIVKLGNVPGRRDIVFLFDPKLIEQVYRNEGPWPDKNFLETLIYYRKIQRKDFFKGVGGLLTELGEDWKKFRTKVNPPLMQPRIANMYLQPINEIADVFIERIKDLRDSKSEMPADFANEINKWSLESIAMIALDTRLGCLEPNLKPESEPQKMIEAVHDIFTSSETLELRPPLWKIMSTPTWRKFIKAEDYFTNVASKYINDAVRKMKERKPGDDREPSVLERLLLRDSDPRTACVMALDMLTAGVDTTSYSVANMMYLLSKNPDKQDQLFYEIKKFLPNKNGKITLEMVENMKYLKACTKESMRILGIAPINLRGTVKDMVIGNYRVPKNVNIIMGHLILGLMDEYYPQAARYIPERWLKSRPGDEPDSFGSGEDYENVKDFKTHPFVFMPFGFGPRMCIGKRFAEMELAVMMIKMVRNFQMEYNYGDMTFSTKLLHKPENPLKFKLTDRKN